MAARYPTQMPNNGMIPVRDNRKTLVSYDTTIIEIPEPPPKDETNTNLTDDRWLITVKDGQFPPPQIEWLKDFERNPDEPLKKSYRSGILLQNVDPSAPIVRIGITFMAGADKPTVAKAEMRKISDHKPFQKSHEWRMFTGATLLRRFEIGEDLTIQQKDDSHSIMKSVKERKTSRRSYGSSMSNESSRNLLTKSGPGPDTDGFQSMSLVKRNIQDHVLTIDSDSVELMHGLCPPDHDFDITCALIEIDMFSMRDLMTNYRTIVQNGGRNIAATEVLQILDTMINDVRRLSTRSPRLFRMSTRAMIAQSTNTRYGVDYGSQFVTITTSEGIRKLIDQSSSYYLSLNDSKIDQSYIKPKFMQMLILLLALLNNDDLKKTTKVLESTFQIPGDRESIELLIMKVLPLGAINPEVFLEALFEAYKPMEKKEGGYELRLQRSIWEELQQDLANKGFLVPTIIGTRSSANQSVWTTDQADDLEAMLDESDNDEDPFEDPEESSSRYPYDDPHESRYPRQYNSSGHHSRHQYNQSHQSNQFTQPKLPDQVSWQAPWPIDGVTSSSIFKYLQHDGYMREHGNSSGLVRAINDIPYLEITSDDRDDMLVVKFANKAQYRVSASDIEFISSMQKGSYVLKTIDSSTLATLEIVDTLLNESFMEATTIINDLVSRIRSQFGGNLVRRRSLIGRTSSITSFTALDEVTEAKRVSADIVSPSGVTERIAEAYKIGNRVVYADDIMREMNSSLTKISSSAERLQKELSKHSDIRGVDERARVQQRELQKLQDLLYEVTKHIDLAKSSRTELQQAHRNLPEDPITRVIYPSFTYTAGEKPEWQPYQSQLAKDGKRLIVKAKKLSVTNVIVNPGNVIKVAFGECSVILVVEPLASSGNDVPYDLRAGHTVLWLGYYIVVVEPSSKVKKGYTVQAYFKARSQSLERDPQSRSAGMGAVQTSMSVLV